MNNIVWLASYPKSGNTWFRAFLANLKQDGDKPADINQLNNTRIASAREIFDEAVGIETSVLTFDEVDHLRPEVYQYLSDGAKETRFMKIHDAYTFLPDGRPLVPPSATRAVIYFVRNPLDVVVSFANHSDISLDQSIKRINDETFCFSNDPKREHQQLRQRLLSWSGHVCSWTEAPGLDVHIMKFEDMKRNPLDTFTAAVLFAGLDYGPEQIKKALEFADIKELQRQEREIGFKEKAPRCKAFFNKGETGYWREVLTDKQVKSVIKVHKDVMTQFGYLVSDVHSSSTGIL
jgi:hypothetical protein